MEKESETYCPAIFGSYIAYQAEYSLDDEEWRRIPSVRTSTGIGISQPVLNGGINSTIGLHGYAQAKALTYMFLAIHESNIERVGKKMFIRVQAFDVTFDIKAKKVKEFKELTEEEKEDIEIDGNRKGKHGWKARR